MAQTRINKSSICFQYFGIPRNYPHPTTAAPPLDPPNYSIALIALLPYCEAVSVAAALGDESKSPPAVEACTQYGAVHSPAAAHHHRGEGGGGSPKNKLIFKMVSFWFCSRVKKTKSVLSKLSDFKGLHTY